MADEKSENAPTASNELSGAQDRGQFAIGAKFGAEHANEVRAFNTAAAALDEAISGLDTSELWPSIALLSLLAHFKEMTTAAFQELGLRRPAAAKVLVRASLETTYHIVALRKDKSNLDRLSYKSISSRFASIKNWRDSVAGDAMKAKATQSIADLEKHLLEQEAHKLKKILDVAKLAGMEHDYRTDYAMLSNFTHADLETILRDHVRIDEGNGRFDISSANLNFDVADVTALLVYQHICVLEALGSVDHVPTLGAYLDEMAHRTLS